MIAVSYHARVNVLQALGLASASPFDRWEWLELLASDGGMAPFIALAQQGDMAAALPLMRANKVLVPLANWYNFSWRPLITPGIDAAPLLAALARDLASKTRRLSLSPVPAEDESTEQLIRAFRSAGWAVIAETCDINHILRIQGRSYSEYLASRDGRLRTTLKRKAKKLDVEIHTHFSSAAWDEYEHIYDHSWKPAEGKPAMLRRFAEQEGAGERLRLGIARHQGKPIAAQFWTAENGTAFIHKLAHMEQAAQLSAGTVLTAALMEHVISHDHAQLVDFGTGDDPYKAMWMEETRPRLRIDCFRLSDPAAWPHLAKAGLRKLASPKSGG